MAYKEVTNSKIQYMSTAIKMTYHQSNTPLYSQQVLHISQ